MPETREALVNSTTISTLATLLALLIATPAAYALARFRFRLPPTATSPFSFSPNGCCRRSPRLIPFYLTMRFLGLLDTHTALVLVNTTFIMPFVVVILRQSFLDLPIQLEEAALVDGAGHFTAFLRVALPLVAPAVVATGLIIFGRAWNEFLFALVMTSRDSITIPVHMAGTAAPAGCSSGIWRCGR